MIKEKEKIDGMTVDEYLKNVEELFSEGLINKREIKGYIRLAEDCYKTEGIGPLTRLYLVMNLKQLLLKE